MRVESHTVLDPHHLFYLPTQVVADLLASADQYECEAYRED